MSTAGSDAGNGEATVRASSTDAVHVRAATREDVPQIYDFIVELAVYEREPEGVTPRQAR